VQKLKKKKLKKKILSQCNSMLLELHKLHIYGNEMIEHTVCVKVSTSKITATTVRVLSFPKITKIITSHACKVTFPLLCRGSSYIEWFQIFTMKKIIGVHLKICKMFGEIVNQSFQFIAKARRKNQDPLEQK